MRPANSVPADTVDAAFLACDAVVDGDHPDVARLACALRADTPADTARRCYDWVRDEIDHSIDFQRTEVSCSASQTLASGTGLCFAKSHLLVALLRANGIPAGFCYQRLAVDGDHSPLCTHGLVAVWLDNVGWYRCDPRGNKPGIACAFTPGRENLAYPVQFTGEALYPGIWARPWPDLVAQLRLLPTMAAFLADPIDAQAPPGQADAGDPREIWCKLEA